MNDYPHPHDAPATTPPVEHDALWEVFRYRDGEWKTYPPVGGVSASDAIDRVQKLYAMTIPTFVRSGAEWEVLVPASFEGPLDYGDLIPDTDGETTAEDVARNVAGDEGAPSVFFRVSRVDGLCGHVWSLAPNAAEALEKARVFFPPGVALRAEGPPGRGGAFDVSRGVRFDDPDPEPVGSRRRVEVPVATPEGFGAEVHYEPEEDVEPEDDLAEAGKRMPDYYHLEGLLVLEDATPSRLEVDRNGTRAQGTVRLRVADLLDLCDGLPEGKPAGWYINRKDALKYLLRAGRKPGVPETRDLVKALRVVAREIRRVGGEIPADL